MRDEGDILTGVLAIGVLVNWRTDEMLALVLVVFRAARVMECSTDVRRWDAMLYM
jgi:hypothetical protein